MMKYSLWTSLLFIPFLFLNVAFGSNNSTSDERTDNTKNIISIDFQQSDPLVRYAGNRAELEISRVSSRTFEIKISPVRGVADGETVVMPDSEILVDYPSEEIWKGVSIMDPVRGSVGDFEIEILRSPLRITFYRDDGSIAQHLSWPDEDGFLHFNTDAPVFGLGHGGPQFDRRGDEFPMRDGWGAYERPTHGSRVAVPMLMGADGWSMFIHQPISSDNSFDLRNEKGIFRPSEDQLEKPVHLFVTLWDEPEQVFSEYRKITGKTPMPPKWSLGYMQSHRTLESREQMLQVARNFRERNLPADAVIYLGTGFTPSGWNMGHGSFEFNEEIFDEPEEIFAELSELDFNVVLHTYSPPEGLHGSSMEASSDDSTHIRNYWLDNHEWIFEMGVDGWWPDGGEPLSSESRVARYRMYWEGPLYSRPNVRPWNINRTGYSGVHRYGGWIWSGDPDSYWETLKTQIAVGLNHSVSLTPFWGSDTGGFLPSEELTGELYIRWLQFSVFTASLRGHGRAWHLRLPWGWNTAELGPPEVDQFSDAFEDGYPYPDELRNAMVEPIAREYLQLRYRLLSYNYSLMRETYETGIPPMRAMWLHYPDDPEAVELSDQYMWGRDILIAPVYTKGAETKDLYLPDGLWFDFWTKETFEGGNEINRKVDLGTLPIYVRAGTILPVDPVRQHTAQDVDDPVRFDIYPGADGTTRWYRDDGNSQEYEDGNFAWTLLTWDDDNRQLTIEPDPESDGIYPQAEKIQIQVVEKGATGGRIKSLDWDGQKTTVRFE